MSNNDVMLQIEQRNLAKDKLPEFEIGDTVEVQVRITEGDKSRIQLFSGTVIAMKHGGLRESFTVRRIVDGEGVERTFPIHSPAVVGVKVKRHGIIRRAKLYYLRDRVGKATRLKERIVVRKKTGDEPKKKKRKRGAKAKAERLARAAADGTATKKKKKRKKGKKKAEAKA
jgi:large subunit ribosomal protein L19